LEVRCAWEATANNAAVSSDIARRTIRIRLDAKVDRPWQREDFHHPELRSWARANRGQLVWAALTLGRAWIAAGKPRSTVKPLGMFESWTDTVGGILEFAGIPGFLKNLDDFYAASDVEAAAWNALVQEWWHRHQGDEVGVSKLMKIVAPETGDGIDLNLGHGNEKSQRTRFGKMLRQQRDRYYGDFRITLGNKKENSQMWLLTKGKA
jgi:putative DNA primase/helicase